ncbi:hypothetical protein [Microlunatus flavus]|uniref:Uncharacterized protein n=1 Tax=Microlunatus flavus TaxID=1036181 RepID=A0A1H9BZM5_9ACTN|nr:hypothetical protein [Microlunatus flavus]SEP94201.1 hypothetical protein SAMN05421756_10212 [Microlunatus flavus]
MSRAPRIYPYRVSYRLALGPDGSVYRVEDVISKQPHLLVVSAEDERSATDRVAARLAGLDPDLVVRTGAGLDQLWVALVPEEEQRAVELVGLGGVPPQNWLAEAHGWRSPHARSWALVGLRTLLAVVVLGVLLWVAHLLRT